MSPSKGDPTPDDPARDDPDPDEPGLSIGRLARETGLTTARLRAWERRYGLPRPWRRAAGHRRYSPEEVPRLRSVASLLGRGYRAGQLLALPPDELDRLLATHGSAPEGDLAGLLDKVEGLRREDLRADLLDQAERMGAGAFCERTLAPFLALIGERWAQGQLAIHKEHLASEVLTSVLDHLDAQFPLDATRAALRPICLTTLVGERHALGLRLVKNLFLQHGLHVIHLGVELPVEEIALAARKLDAWAVGISVSSSTGGPRAHAELQALRDALPDEIELIAGGHGVGYGARGPKGVRYLTQLPDLLKWIADNARTGAQAGCPEPLN